MSKPKVKKQDELTELDRDGRVIVTTSRGHRVECLPIATMLDELSAEYNEKMPSPPTHQISDVTGTTIDVPYTEESISKLADVPEADKEAWAKYLEEKAVLEAELAERRIRVIATRGIKVIDMPAEETWIAEHEFLGYTVPDAPLPRLYHYVKTEVLGTKEDGIKVTAGIYRASGLDEEVLNQIEASFRASRGKQKREDAGTDTEDSGTDESGQAARLVEQSELHD
jgi:hypothetical protein